MPASGPFIFSPLVDKAPVPADGPLIVLLPAGGPFRFSPLVDDASVPAGRPFVFSSTSQLSLQVTIKTNLLPELTADVYVAGSVTAVVLFHS